MDKAKIRKLLKRLWRKNNLQFRGGRPGVSISELVLLSERRNRAKKLPHFDLWNELYDEYASWFLSLLTVLYSELRRRKTRRLPYQFFRATSVLAFRIFSDLLAIRLLCRAGFDVSAKALARTTIEYIDVFTLIIAQPQIAREFNKSDRNTISNAFWHKYVSRGKIRKHFASHWGRVFGPTATVEEWDEWLYRYHDILGMSVHPSFSGSVFSALTLGSGAQDNWIGFLGERADISTDTMYHLIVHIWKIMFLFQEFPFRNEASPRLAIKYLNRNELHRHAKIGGNTLMSLLVSIWNPSLKEVFFRDIDMTNIRPDKKNTRNTPGARSKGRRS